MRNRCISPHSWSRVPSRLVAGLLRLLADWPIPLTSWCKGHERPLALTLYRVALKAASGKSIYGHLGRKWPFISSQFLTSPYITPYIQDILAYTVYQQSSQLLCKYHPTWWEGGICKVTLIKFNSRGEFILWGIWCQGQSAAFLLVK